MYLSQNYTIAWKKCKHNIFYLLLQITPTHSNYIKIWATQSFVTFKTQWKNETYENFIYFKIFFTWNDIQNSFIHTKKHIFLWKSVSFFWFDFTIVLSILQKLKVANNLITILGYSNDKNIYIAKNIISIDQLILFTRFGIFSQQDSTHTITLCFQKSLRKLTILN